MTKKYFGTDGIRGRVNRGNINGNINSQQGHERTFPPVASLRAILLKPTTYPKSIIAARPTVGLNDSDAERPAKR